MKTDVLITSHCDVDDLLFYTPHAGPGTTGYSPDAVFSVQGALDGQAFTSTFPPSATRYPKLLIITEETVQDEQARIACRYLARKVIPGTKPFVILRFVLRDGKKMTEPFNPEEWDNTEGLTSFDTTTDYALLGAAFNRVVVLQGSALHRLIVALRTDYSLSLNGQTHAFYEIHSAWGEMAFETAVRLAMVYEPLAKLLITKYQEKLSKQQARLIDILQVHPHLGQYLTEEFLLSNSCEFNSKHLSYFTEAQLSAYIASDAYQWDQLIIIRPDLFPRLLAEKETSIDIQNDRLKLIEVLPQVAPVLVEALLNCCIGPYGVELKPSYKQFFLYCDREYFFAHLAKDFEDVFFQYKDGYSHQLASFWDSYRATDYLDQLLRRYQHDAEALWAIHINHPWARMSFSEEDISQLLAYKPEARVELLTIYGKKDFLNRRASHLKYSPFFIVRLQKKELQFCKEFFDNIPHEYVRGDSIPDELNSLLAEYGIDFFKSWLASENVKSIALLFKFSSVSFEFAKAIWESSFRDDLLQYVAPQYSDYSFFLASWCADYARYYLLTLKEDRLIGHEQKLKIIFKKFPEFSSMILAIMKKSPYMTFFSEELLSSPDINVVYEVLYELLKNSGKFTADELPLSARVLWAKSLCQQTLAPTFTPDEQESALIGSNFYFSERRAIPKETKQVTVFFDVFFRADDDESIKRKISMLELVDPSQQKIVKRYDLGAGSARQVSQVSASKVAGEIYGGSAKQFFQPSRLAESLSKNPEKIKLNQYALFMCKRESDKTDRKLQEYLADRLRMATVLYYKVEFEEVGYGSFDDSCNENLARLPLGALEKISVRDVDNTTHVTLRCVGFEHFRQVDGSPNCYHFPVLDKEQVLVSCDGASLFKNEYGQWILEALDITACEVEIAVSRAAPTHISKDNIQKEIRVDLPGIAEIKAFLSLDLGDMTCGDRVSFLLRFLKGGDHFFYADNGSDHAYLAIKHGDEFIHVDLGGGGILQEVYHSTPKKEKPSVFSPAQSLSPIPSLHKVVHKDEDDLSHYAGAGAASSIEPSAPLRPRTLLEQLPKHTGALIMHSDTLSVMRRLLREIWRDGRDNTVLPVLSFAECQVQSKPKPRIVAEDSVHSETKTRLGSFLKEAAKDPDTLFTLLIDVSGFKTTEFPQLNTLIDEISVTNVRIIALCAQVPTDISFTRRFITRIDATLISLDLPRPITKSDSKTLELWQHPQWQEALCGSVDIQEDDTLYWQRSDNVDLLEKGRDVIIRLSCIASDQREEARRELTMAMETGLLFHHGYGIRLSPDIHIEIDESPFDFSKFCAHVYENRLLEAVPPQSIIINTELFEGVLRRKKTHDKHLQSLRGWIELAKEVKRLSVYVTSNLSEGQWIALLQQAKLHGVVLSVYTAPNVGVPPITHLPPEADVHGASSTSDAQVLPRVVVTTHAETYVATMLSSEATIISSEDVSYQALFCGIDFETDGVRFYNFSSSESQLLNLLMNPREHVIIKGVFSDVMLRYFHRILATGYVEINGRPVMIQSRLTLVVEGDESLLQNFKWLGDRAYYQEVARRAIAETECLDEKDFPVYASSDFSERSHEAFLSLRKNTFLSLLDRHRWLCLRSETGTGKTSLIKGLEAEGRIELYAGYAQLAAFFADPDTKKLIVFFADESNFIDKHLTFLSDNEILFNGIFHLLPANKKFVFAFNPHEYGGGRLEQRLFTEYAIPVFVLRDFPAATIWHLLLKPIYHESFGFAPEEFAQLCQEKIQGYIAEHLADPNKNTVRRLQYEVMVACVENKTRIKKSLTAQAGFFKLAETLPILESHAEAKRALRIFLSITHQQRKKQLPQHIGLSAFVLSGPTGVGKTTLIKQVLGERADVLFLKAGAVDVIEALTWGLSNGKLVCLDEIDTLVNDHEATLTALLNGLCPETLEVLANPGKLIVSINGAAYPGRGMLSRALGERAECVTVTYPSTSDIFALLTAHRPDIAEADRKRVSHEYAQQLQEDPLFTLQDVVTTPKAKVVSGGDKIRRFGGV